jgi:hypothetical protein
LSNMIFSLLIMFCTTWPRQSCRSNVQCFQAPLARAPFAGPAAWRFGARRIAATNGAILAILLRNVVPPRERVDSAGSSERWAPGLGRKGQPHPARRSRGAGGTHHWRAPADSKRRVGPSGVAKTVSTRRARGRPLSGRDLFQMEAPMPNLGEATSECRAAAATHGLAWLDGAWAPALESFARGADPRATLL